MPTGDSTGDTQRFREVTDWLTTHPFRGPEPIEDDHPLYG